MNILNICLTGHRPDKLGGYNNPAYYNKLTHELYLFLRFALNNYDGLVCHSGLALGADSCWSRAILKLKEEGHPVMFVAHIPNWDHCNRWIDQKDKDFWQEQINKADEIVVVDPNREKSFGQALNMRNDTMVTRADMVLAVYNGDISGGTHNAVKLAKRKNKRIIKVDPQTFIFSNF